MNTPIAGWCAAGFEGVRAVFSENFAERGEVGAALCVRRHGEVIVDLWGGWREESKTLPWEGDTLVDYYSAGKAVLATLSLQLVDEGRIDLDAPLAAVWPEFAVEGKERATLRHALSHRAAVPAIREPLTDADLLDWGRMADALAATRPWWEPGTRHAYHTNTFGHLVGEVIHRVTGKLPGDRLRDVVAPRGVDVWIGLPAEEQLRCADVIWAPPKPIGLLPADAFERLEGEVLMNALAHLNPPGYSSIGLVNTARWRAANVPSTNGHGTARGLAQFYALLLDGTLLSSGMLAEATRVQSSGYCPILDDDIDFGLGFVPTRPDRAFGPNPRSFGHFGTGGAVGFGDPDAGIAFGYVMNHVIPRWQSTRNRALIDSVYTALDAAPTMYTPGAPT